MFVCNIDQAWLLLMSDEGSQKNNRSARYLLPSYDQFEE